MTFFFTNHLLILTDIFVDDLFNFLVFGYGRVDDTFVEGHVDFVVGSEGKSQLRVLPEVSAALNDPLIVHLQ